MRQYRGSRFQNAQQDLAFLQAIISRSPYNRTMLILLLLFTAGTLHAAWQAGAAAVDITPTESIWLAGYASRTKPSESIRQPIHAKALALRDESGATSVIVTLDLVGIRREWGE